MCRADRDADRNPALKDLFIDLVRLTELADEVLSERFNVL